MTRLTDDGNNGKATSGNPDISESKSIRVKETADARADDLWRDTLNRCQSCGVVICQVSDEISQR